MTSKLKRPWLKLLSIWMNAIGDAWNMGEADWAYEEVLGGVAGVYMRSAAVHRWYETYAATNDEQLATDAVVELAKANGIDLKRHRLHHR